MRAASVERKVNFVLPCIYRKHLLVKSRGVKLVVSGPHISSVRNDSVYERFFSTMLRAKLV
jgi:hypothetical protein